MVELEFHIYLHKRAGSNSTRKSSIGLFSFSILDISIGSFYGCGIFEWKT
jgi:hypothetical protein